MTFISLNGATLDLPIYDAHGRSFKKRLLQMGKLGRISETNHGVVVVRALDDINLRLEPGDRVGLIGHNGAGKSTLLRLMAGIYAPSRGTVQSEGKTVPLLDISLGMDDNSTGRQNIRLRGLLLGMSSDEIRAKQAEMAQFSELGDYLDLPLRTYSSGMRVRLAFAVSTAVDADILLLDEVMGVGDASFRQKANERIRAMHDRAKIVVLALHANEEIRKSCNKALWMDKGRIRLFGPADEVLSAYAASS